MLPSGTLDLRYYRAHDGGSPFADWFGSLDAIARAKVTVAISRLEQGNLSNVKSVRQGVLEYRIDFGPGYRVYFGRDGCSPAARSGDNSRTSRERRRSG
jgi:putative addiction module killer protein